MAKSKPDPTDKHVGSRVRMRRMMLSMSQEKLGDALGLTFQQVQKYEKGVNRIGAGRLQKLAQILQVPVTFFYEGLAPATSGKKSPDAAFGDNFLATTDGLAIARAFARIDDRKLRRHIATLVASIAGTDAPALQAAE